MRSERAPSPGWRAPGGRAILTTKALSGHGDACDPAAIKCLACSKRFDSVKKDWLEGKLGATLEGVACRGSPQLKPQVHGIYHESAKWLGVELSLGVAMLSKSGMGLESRFKANRQATGPNKDCRLDT